jgi:hypothetical protein
MELIDRYLQWIRFALPKASSDDVASELSEDINSCIEEREKQLGRPLNEEEQVELLRSLGHPFTLAARYRDDEPRNLIGPAFFPTYLSFLKIALGLVLLVHLCMSAWLLASGDSPWVSLRSLANLLPSALSVFAWVTLSFALAERIARKVRAKQQGYSGIHPQDTGARPQQTWDPRTLPPIVNLRAAQDRGRSPAALAAAVCGVTLWLIALYEPSLLLGPAAAYIAFGPIWSKMYPLFLLLGVLTTIKEVIASARPDWRQVRAGLGAATAALGLLALGLIGTAPNLFIPAQPGMLQALMVVNTVVRAVFIAIAVAMASSLLLTVWMWQRTAPSH